MVAATGYDLLKTLHPKQRVGEAAIAPLHVNTHGYIILSIGLIVSFLIALGVVEWFLQFVRKHGFAVFAVYRILLAIALILFGSRLFVA